MFYYYCVTSYVILDLTFVTRSLALSRGTISRIINTHQKFTKQERLQPKEEIQLLIFSVAVITCVTCVSF